MAYEKFKEVLDKETFFENWSREQINDINSSIADEIYNKYIVKCLVLQRDEFTCQNENCSFCDNIPEAEDLTMHHVKFQKNNGKDKMRNCVTICRAAHKGFHRGKNVLTFWGDTYQVHREERIDWKQIKATNRDFRKSLKEHRGVKLSWELLAILMDFLTRDMSQESLDDD